MRRVWLIFSQAVTVGVALLFVVSTFKPQWLPGPAPTGAPAVVSITAAPDSPAGTASAPLAAASYSASARRAAPAVVSVTARKTTARVPQSDDPWFRFFFGDRAQQQPQVGLGSGVIVSSDGYLLTNNHVIEGANEIEVQLVDGREAQAQLIGTDPESDLAVLKIDLDKLPVVAFGNADQLQVGDVVLAIGNPFNVGQTVTSGIVSALGRNRLGINTFENFIQTDAAINPGNSGGALVDAQGHLVGINTAIYSHSRSVGSLGIGFAIPTSTARQVMESLIRDGEVRRGWIGVEPRDLTPEIAQTLNLPIRQGVLITGVLQDGPASQAGMRPGDVVVRVGERAVTNTAELLTAVAALAPRSDATLSVQRGAQALELKLTVAQRPRTRREQ